MDTTTWNASLTRRFTAAIDQLEAALRACPDDLWEASLWEVGVDDPGVQPEGTPLSRDELQVYSTFWSIAYHTLFFLDLYLSGGLEQFDAGFAPPAPFRLEDQDAGRPPARAYTRAELEAYLAHGRRKALATIEALTDEDWSRTCQWGPRQVPFAELLLVNLNHVREHGAQLGMFLGQHR